MEVFLAYEFCCPVSELSIPVPWGEIRGKVWGPDHGCPVLCLHGWADNCGAFNTLIPLLPKECRYVAVDLAGHGRSSHRPPGDFYHFPLYVMDVLRVTEALQWSKFSIIGHSMGDTVHPISSFELLPSSFLQKEMSGVLRQGLDEMLQYEKTKEKKARVYTYEKAFKRLKAVNTNLSEESVHALLERGLVQVEGGVVFSRDFRINLKNIARITLEQSMDMQSRIKASVLHTVVTVPGDHHIHLNNPAVVAPIVSEFLRTKVLLQPNRLIDGQTSKL
uniref:Serine hydrolase like n=1 Tax=Mastacembelus armatus TaxID=205130 RepID=A0A3Q3L8H9_9TELE